MKMLRFIPLLCAVAVLGILAPLGTAQSNVESSTSSSLIG